MNGEQSGSEIFDDLSNAIEEILEKKKTFGVTSKPDVALLVCLYLTCNDCFQLYKVSFNLYMYALKTLLFEM